LTREERQVLRLRPKKEYRKHLKESCQRCGFIPLFPCQLDVDHIDNDFTNNTPSNLQTLCANCHRLVTYLRKYPHLASFV
ncbi:HNH endonuclease signature motif containing protein, partial [Erwinia amylovora]|uniref:HNH endonuclease signature motif containing protein n=1 Tax=Erwinia amylovora TaxID=552 RepID=UPI003860165B